MRLKIGARRSDLARLQAYSVGDALQAAHPGLEISYSFKESLGDKNLSDPLWKMPERGVFTEDFVADLENGEVDLVVHSWKDLPVEDRKNTVILATLPRADSRDLLLFRRDRLSKKDLRILSSSPRRAYNLEAFFREFLPWSLTSLEFVPVRGNIPTRVRKLCVDGEADGLIVAKAALDRLLSAKATEFAPVQAELRKNLEGIYPMVLPVELNPPAAAQGALAIEALRTRADIAELCAAVHCPKTFAAAEQERVVLRSYGGGCHQKIGVSFQHLEQGTLLQVRGEDKAGRSFFRRTWTSPESYPVASVAAPQLWPKDEAMSETLFERIFISVLQQPSGPLWVSRADALPQDWKLTPQQVVWTSGLKTWKKLAARGIWVHGSAESLGEEFPSSLIGQSLTWTKLSHEEGFPTSGVKFLPTYRLTPKATKPDWSHTTHFYWSSASQCLRALELAPEILSREHACGPGNSYRILREKIPQLRVFLSYKEWRDHLCKT